MVGGQDRAAGDYMRGGGQKVRANAWGFRASS